MVPYHLCNLRIIWPFESKLLPSAILQFTPYMLDYKKGGGYETEK